MSKPTKGELDALTELLAKATPGPWGTKYREWGNAVTAPDPTFGALLVCEVSINSRRDEGRYNQALIVALRNAAEHLLACEAALHALTSKLDAIAADPSFQGIWPYLSVHNYHYTGPNYEAELDAARALTRGKDE